MEDLDIGEKFILMRMLKNVGEWNGLLLQDWWIPVNMLVNIKVP